MGALSVTTNPKYQAPFEPLLPDVFCGKLNHVEALNTLLTENTCAVIVEPVQGEGGIHPAETEWLIQLRKKCDEVGAVLIFDEIQASQSCFGMISKLNAFSAVWSLSYWYTMGSLIASCGGSS